MENEELLPTHKETINYAVRNAAEVGSAGAVRSTLKHLAVLLEVNPFPYAETVLRKLESDIYLVAMPMLFYASPLGQVSVLPGSGDFFDFVLNVFGSEEEAVRNYHVLGVTEEENRRNLEEAGFLAIISGTEAARRYKAELN